MPLSPEEKLLRRREANARYRAKNPEAVRARERAAKARYKARHPERYAEAARRNASNFRQKYPEKVREGLRRWYGANTRTVRSKWLFEKYGITVEQWEEKFADQGQVCGCCGTAEPGKKGWQTDHDHQTGKLRDILCGACNKGLGLFGDSEDRLQKAIVYLVRHRS